jgi:hypothetical protein
MSAPALSGRKRRGACGCPVPRRSPRTASAVSHRGRAARKRRWLDKARHSRACHRAQRCTAPCYGLARLPRPPSTTGYAPPGVVARCIYRTMRFSAAASIAIARKALHRRFGVPHLLWISGRHGAGQLRWTIPARLRNGTRRGIAAMTGRMAGAGERLGRDRTMIVRNGTPVADQRSRLITGRYPAAFFGERRTQRPRNAPFPSVKRRSNGAETESNGLLLIHRFDGSDRRVSKPPIEGRCSTAKRRNSCDTLPVSVRSPLHRFTASPLHRFDVGRGTSDVGRGTWDVRRATCDVRRATCDVRCATRGTADHPCRANVACGADSIGARRQAGFMKAHSSLDITASRRVTARGRYMSR